MVSWLYDTLCSLSHQAHLSQTTIPCLRKGSGWIAGPDLGERRDRTAGEGSQHFNDSVSLDREANDSSISAKHRRLQISSKPRRKTSSSRFSNRSGGLPLSTSAASFSAKRRIDSKNLTTLERKRMGIYPIKVPVFTFIFVQLLSKGSAQSEFNSTSTKSTSTALSATAAAPPTTSPSLSAHSSSNTDHSLSSGVKAGIAVGVIVLAAMLTLSVLFCKYLFRDKSVYGGAPPTSRAWADEEQIIHVTNPSVLELQERQSTAASSRRHTFVEHLFHRDSIRSGRASRKQVMPEPGMEVGTPGVAESSRGIQRPITFIETLFHRGSLRSERASRKQVLAEPGLETIPPNAQSNQHQSPLVSPLSATPLNAADFQPLSPVVQSAGEAHPLSTLQPASSFRTPLSRHRPRARHNELYELPGSTYHNPFRRHFFLRRASDRSRRRSRGEAGPTTVQELAAVQLPLPRPHLPEQARTNHRANRVNRMPGYSEFEVIVEHPTPPVSLIEPRSVSTDPEINKEELYVTPVPREETERLVKEQIERTTAHERRRTLRTQPGDPEQTILINRQQAKLARLGRILPDAE
jgi:hypothetical protein